MSGKLDKSLDEIISTQRTSARGRGNRVRTRRSAAGKAAVAAPVGGIKKTVKGAKGAGKSVPTGPSGLGNGEGRILVSGLPKDITEQMIKDYFGKSIGPVKRVEISYGPGGTSRGIATIVFARSDMATKAVETLHGIPVDGKPIKVELIINAVLAKAIPAPKGLSERISQPRSQPKSAAAPKKNEAATRGKAGRGRGGKARNSRPAKKTAEELDSEMVDYWNNGAAATEGEGAANGAVQVATNGDATMDDEIL
ncbi:related to RNA annealing protein [Phialocephala subalpina]|uniref:Related to RNA annealing protein n=1 Tax=Phialocephala subalpina TaxID=576137 RepID=A0A1L7WGC5_9HELO|nr:related to RNA annealing protein [Phialocephala subalpina]